MLYVTILCKELNSTNIPLELYTYISTIIIDQENYFRFSVEDRNANACLLVLREQANMYSMEITIICQTNRECVIKYAAEVDRDTHDYINGGGVIDDDEGVDDVEIHTENENTTYGYGIREVNEAPCQVTPDNPTPAIGTDAATDTGPTIANECVIESFVIDGSLVTEDYSNRLSEDEAIIELAIHEQNSIEVSESIRQKSRILKNKLAECIIIKKSIDQLSASVRTETICSILGQIDKLKDYTLVENVWITKDSIVVTTKELITDNKIVDHKRIIGRMLFNVEIDAFLSINNPPSYICKIFNLDRTLVRPHTLTLATRTGFQCGHVNLSGDACWGNVWEMIYEACVNQDLITLIEILIRFVKNPNQNDPWGTIVKYFPIEHQAESTNEA